MVDIVKHDERYIMPRFTEEKEVDEIARATINHRVSLVGRIESRKMCTPTMHVLCIAFLQCFSIERLSNGVWLIYRSRHIFPANNVTLECTVLR